jgi:hypothetical protein
MAKLKQPQPPTKRIRLDARDASIITTSVAINREVHTRLMQLALARHKTFTGLVREALDHYISRNWPPKGAR